MDPCTGRSGSPDDVDSMEMSYEYLKKITEDFSEERIIGSGAFGVVYEGALENGKKVAVKVLRGMAALDDNAFRNEFQNVARLKHKNIVQCLGYCNDPEQIIVKLDDGTEAPAEKMHKALCFEYVDNGSLHPYISDENQGLEWHIRFKIIQGICEGLKHLRVGLEKPLWHLDLKPDNILLDREITPKIADFGIARLIIGDEKTRKTMSSVGTCGYWPPEFVKFQSLSEAFDIFSFGVIIAKIMIGTEGYNDCATMQPRKLVKHVHNNWKKKLQDTVKPRAVELYCQQVKACIEIASKCLAEDRKQRPCVQDIAVMLNDTETNIPMQIEEKGGGELIRSIYRKYMYTWDRLDVPTQSLPLSFLEDITDNFSYERVLGRGSIGVVYKGDCEDGQVIAVKKLYQAGAGVLNLHLAKMLEGLHKVNHENIIKHFGYCRETTGNPIKYYGSYVMTEMTTQVVCSEYMQNGSLERHISDESHGYDWCTRYKIIKGTCDGLAYLQMEHHILHLNLKASNILLDENMVPKLADFGWPRSTESWENNREIIGFDIRYVPPEFINKQVTSAKYDIYSLGVIILEIISGTTKLCHDFTEVLGKWRKRLAATSKPRAVEGYCQQVEKCIKIALKCVEYDMHKRPDIGDVIHMLDETEAFIQADGDLLDVHPMELRFPFRPKKHVSCLLQLLNKDDDPVAFMLQSNSPKKYLTKLPLCGVVPPRCTYTIALTTSKQPPLPPSKSDEGFLLQGMKLSDHQEQQLMDLDPASVFAEYDNLFAKAQETVDNVVQKMTLKSIYSLPAEEASSKLSQLEIEILATLNSRQVTSIEVHPLKPWIMTTHHAGNLRIWNYETMEVLNPFEVPDEPVYVAKFITQDEWIVAGDGNGHIHVFSYDYDGNEEDTSFEAHNSRIVSLAVHPTDSYVLSSSHEDHRIKLWYWDPYWDFDKGSWELKATFEGHSDKVSQILFNQEDTDSFASASWDGTVKIWDLESRVCNSVITLDTHPGPLLCVDYVTGADRQYLITGSKDGATQIWDLETKRQIENLQGHAQQISVVYCHPELQKLITGSLDGTVRIWDSTTYRLENIVAFNLGAVYDFGYVDKDNLQRIVVGCHEGIAIMKINFV